MSLSKRLKTLWILSNVEIPNMMLDDFKGKLAKKWIDAVFPDKHAIIVEPTLLE